MPIYLSSASGGGEARLKFLRDFLSTLQGPNLIRSVIDQSNESCSEPLTRKFYIEVKGIE